MAATTSQKIQHSNEYHSTKQKVQRSASADVSENDDMDLPLPEVARQLLHAAFRIAREVFRAAEEPRSRPS